MQNNFSDTTDKGGHLSDNAWSRRSLFSHFSSASQNLPLEIALEAKLVEIPMLHSVPDFRTKPNQSPECSWEFQQKGEEGNFGYVEMGRGHLVVGEGEGEGDWRGNEGGRIGAWEVRCRVGH